VLGTSLAAWSASAATITVTQQNPGNVFADAAGQNDWSQSGDVVFDGIDDFSGSTSGGLFRLTGDDGTNPPFDFLAFCFEFEQIFQSGSSYDETGIGDPLLVDYVDALFSNAYGGVVDALTAAAFQFALWEITTDWQSTLDLDTGNFQLLDSADPQMQPLAATWLQNIVDGAWTGAGGVYTLLANPTDQDLIRVGPASDVPLPSSVLLLAGGLAGLGIISRRRPRA